MELFGQTSIQLILFLIFYRVTGVVPLIAAVYLLLRRGNAIAPGVTPPVRLRRWTPRSDFDIMLFHDIKDDVVPVENYYAMKQFLDDNHIKTEGLVGDYSGNAKESLGLTNHEASAATFFLKIIEWIRANY